MTTAPSSRKGFLVLVFFFLLSRLLTGVMISMSGIGVAVVDLSVSCSELKGLLVSTELSSMVLTVKLMFWLMFSSVSVTELLKYFL